MHRTKGSRRPQNGATIYFILAWLLVLCIVVQTFLAGLGMFTDFRFFRHHVIFVHLFEFVPLVMLLTAFYGKLPASAKRQCVILFLLIFVQYLTANLKPAGALHPVVALLLFGYSLYAAREAQLLRRSRRRAQPQKGEVAG